MKEAEDVCQETWRAFFFAFDRFVADDGDPERVLYKIAYCRSMDFWRARMREPAVVTDEAGLTQLVESVSPFQPGCGIEGLR